jgi:glycosyltransferase involved in cell wall biosynthesis
MTSLGKDQGGIASTNRNIVRALVGRGEGSPRVEVRVLAYHGDTPQLGPEYVPADMTLRAEGCGGSRSRFVRRYLAQCLAWRPDLVFVDHLHLAVVPYLFRRLGFPPYALSCHRSEFEEGLGRLRQAAYRGARLRWSNSCFMAERMRAMFPGVPVEVCEPAIDEVGLPPSSTSDRLAARIRERLNDAGESLNDASGEPRRLGENFALIVSRLAAGERYKGHDQLIAAWPSVVREVSNAQLVIAGDGDDAGRLRQRARDSGAGAAILFAGFAAPDVLAELFARCRLFAMPSRGEGFGVVYLEAMRAARPCLASRVDGGGEIVVDGVTGLLVDPGNQGELSAALVRLHRDPVLARRMGEAGRQRCEERYRFEHFQTRLWQRLASVLPELSSRMEGRPAPQGLVSADV